MKRCPACQKTYEDSQNFCLDDGTTLVSAAGDSSGSAFPPENPYNRNSAATEVLPGAPATGGWSPPPPTTPPAAPYMMNPTYPAQKRSPLPWIILGVLALAGAGVGIYFATRGSDSSTTTTNNRGTTASPTASPGRTSSTPTRASGTGYDSPDGRFSIALPPGFGAFTSQKTTSPTAAGPIDLTIMQSENPQGACVVGYSDFPEASFEGRTPKKMLEDGRDGALKNIKATLEKQEDLTVQGKTGLAIYGSTNQGGKDIYVRFHFVLDKPRAYQMGYLAYNRADLDKPDVQAYFDSFRIK